MAKEGRTLPAWRYYSYTYDANGNMKTRINTTNTGNNITGITYNYLNLPSSVTAAGGNVTYVYDATGRKLRSTNGIHGQTRDYIDGIEYVAGAIELIHHSEGRILNTGSSYLFEYYLRDHLGNNRSGFGQGVNITKPEFSADYYPFGMQYQQYVRSGSPKNNYLYNGKELQDGLKLYDYGARLYDPAIGRWGTMDPLAEQYENISAFNYALNNPIKFIDPDGREVRSGDKAGLIIWAKMRVAMNGGDDEDDQDDPKKKKEVVNNLDKEATKQEEDPYQYTGSQDGAYSMDEFIAANKELTREQIISQLDNRSKTFLNSQQGGPAMRYVRNPHDGKVLDMRHMLIVGKLPPVVGNLVEVGQWMGGQASGMNPQDFYSNGVGYQFYMQYSRLQNFFYPTTFTKQLQNFFYSPKIIINH